MTILNWSTKLAPHARRCYFINNTLVYIETQLLHPSEPTLPQKKDSNLDYNLYAVSSHKSQWLTRHLKTEYQAPGTTFPSLPHSYLFQLFELEWTRWSSKPRLPSWAQHKTQNPKIPKFTLNPHTQGKPKPKHSKARRRKTKLRQSPAHAILNTKKITSKHSIYSNKESFVHAEALKTHTQPRDSQGSWRRSVNSHPKPPPLLFTLGSLEFLSSKWNPRNSKPRLPPWAHHKTQNTRRVQNSYWPSQYDQRKNQKPTHPKQSEKTSPHSSTTRDPQYIQTSTRMHGVS